MKKHDFSFTLSDGAIILPKYVSKTEEQKSRKKQKYLGPMKIKKNVHENIA